MENGNGRHEWIDIAASILLGVATIASAFCGYQATLWSGEQTAHLANANNRQFESMRKTTAADREALIDVATFFNVQQAVFRHDERMITFVKEHARPEFRGPLAAWLHEAEVTGRTDATPFERHEYQLADAKEAQRLRDEGLKANDAATHANAQGDLWVMHTVFVTLALFFLSISTQARLRKVRYINLAFGALVLAATFISAARLPRAPDSHLRNPERPLPERPAEVS